MGLKEACDYIVQKLEGDARGAHDASDAEALIYSKVDWGNELLMVARQFEAAVKASEAACPSVRPSTSGETRSLLEQQRDHLRQCNARQAQEIARLRERCVELAKLAEPVGVRSTVTVVCYWNHRALYKDGALLGKISHYLDSRVLEWLGYEVQELKVPEEDMPGWDSDNRYQDYQPPPRLDDIIRQLADLKEARRVQKIADLRKELAQLEEGDDVSF
jgi:hypothetical protein